MPEQKNKFALRIAPETQELVKSLYKQDNCRSQNEFMEKAILFYAGYIAAGDATDFLSKAMLSVIEGTVMDSENRIKRMLFKLSTELGLLTRIVASYEGLENVQLSRMRGAVVEELKRTNGTIQLEKAIRDYQASP